MSKISLTSPLYKIRRELKSRQPIPRYDANSILGIYFCPSDQKHYKITSIDKTSGKKPLVKGKCIDCTVNEGVVRMYLDEFEREIRQGVFVKQ